MEPQIKSKVIAHYCKVCKKETPHLAVHNSDETSCVLECLECGEMTEEE